MGYIAPSTTSLEPFHGRLVNAHQDYVYTAEIQDFDALFSQGMRYS